jgi:type IV secretory pathway VirB2 component (pilin)
MYGKLSVVMGLTWTLGFAMEYSVIVKFIFLIVNSLQGNTQTLYISIITNA